MWWGSHRVRWRPRPGSWLDRWGTPLATVGTIVTCALSLGGLAWALISSDEGRLKAILLWCIGSASVIAILMVKMARREHQDVRYGRALEPLHMSHHLLRDASYMRYIQGRDERDWKAIVEESLRQFQSAMSVATGSPCHATIKTVVDHGAAGGRSDAGLDGLIVDTYLRSSPRNATFRHGVRSNTVANNSDFRHLFSVEKNNRCWSHDDLLQLEGYENPHWPDNPTPRNVPYRSTMVWPIRKVIRDGTSTEPVDFIVHGFLTIDSPDANVLVFERHFHLGAGYADDLLGVLWDPKHVREVSMALDAPGLDRSQKEALVAPSRGQDTTGPRRENDPTCGGSAVSGSNVQSRDAREEQL